MERHGDKLILLFEDEQHRTSTWTYTQFDQMVNRTAGALAGIGVRKGNKVNLHLTNCPEFLFFWFAVARIGAVMVPTNPLSPAAEFKYPLTHSDSIVTVT